MMSVEVKINGVTVKRVTARRLEPLNKYWEKKYKYVVNENTPHQRTIRQRYVSNDPTEIARRLTYYLLDV